MAEVTGISWTKSTFNPWIGCTRVSPGCDHCYAEALDRRHKWGGKVHWGVGQERMRTRPANWDKLLKWNRQAPSETFAGRLGFWPVFCASLADVFDNEVPNAWRSDLWALVETTPNLSWLIVTKRIGNVARMVPPAWLDGCFPRQVRLMISVVNQEEANRDVPKLLALRCSNGVSYEPALGPVDWQRYLLGGNLYGCGFMDAALDWIIIGGESAQGGAAARPFQLSWARSTVAQCAEAAVPVFVKQLGPRPLMSERGDYLLLKDRAGADPEEWPEDLVVREFPK